METKGDGERDEGMNSRVTERAVYWPRKCFQAAGQSAWLVPPRVANSSLADESRPLFALSIEASHHQRRAVYLRLPSHTPPPEPSLSSENPNRTNFTSSLGKQCISLCWDKRKMLKTGFCETHDLERRTGVMMTCENVTSPIQYVDNTCSFNHPHQSSIPARTPPLWFLPFSLLFLLLLMRLHLHHGSPGELTCSTRSVSTTHSTHACIKEFLPTCLWISGGLGYRCQRYCFVCIQIYSFKYKYP